MRFSIRLGEIKNEQFQKALDYFSLGKLLNAKAIPFGNFGQNVFLTTDKGEYVFRGKPHYSWQFKNEKLMTDLLHKKTKTPVAYPYLINENKIIFGWGYAISPKLKGKQIIDEKTRKELTQKDWKELAKAYGQNLAEMHSLIYEYPGKYTDNYEGIKPFSPSYSSWIIDSINHLLEKSLSHNNKTTKEDANWVQKIIRDGKEALNIPFVPSFVMQDYQQSNTLADKINGKWYVVGVFDFMESYFGDYEADLPRMRAQLIDQNKKLADIFLKTYLLIKKPRAGFEKRYPIYVILDRLLVWEWLQRNNNQLINKNSLKEWCEKYTQLDYS